MIALTQAQLAQMAGADLLALVSNQQSRQEGDLQVGDETWKVYSSTIRGKQHGEWVNLWRAVPKGAARPETVHIRGTIDQRIGEMRLVER